MFQILNQTIFLHVILLDFKKSYPSKYWPKSIAINSWLILRPSHIDDMVQLILELQQNNDLAYKSEEGSWYFNVAKAQPNYGTQLLQLDWEHMGGSSSSTVGACSAMARRYLGNTIDVHCGGTDLKFPHHENE